MNIFPQSVAYLLIVSYYEHQYFILMRSNLSFSFLSELVFFASSPLPPRNLCLSKGSKDILLCFLLEVFCFWLLDLEIQFVSD